MPERVAKGTWVEIHRVVLEPEQRAPQVPDDTRRVPLEMKVKGVLRHDAVIGDTAEIRTAAGRIITGTLIAVNPTYTHSFGAPVPELLAVGWELRGHPFSEKRE